MGGIFFNGIFWTFGFLRMGTTGLVAQAHGARDEESLRLHFWRGMVSAAAIGTLIVLVRGPLIAASLSLLSASGAVRQNALVYCDIRIWSAPAALANYVVLGFLLGRQHARMALALQAAVNVVNVAVALALVVWLHWGVAGIAAATFSADWAGLILGLVLIGVVWPRAAGQKINWREIADGPSWRHLFALNRDLFLRTISLVAAYGWFTRTGARAGDATLAANAVLLNLHWIATYALDGFANATEALVGEAVGARRFDDYRAVLKASTVSAGAVAAALSLMFVFAGSSLVSLFTNQEAVRAMALRYLPWAMVLPLVSVWGYQMDGVFIGATRARELRDSMVIAFLGYLALAIVLGRAMGNNGLWCAFCCFMILRGSLLAARLPRVQAMFASGAPATA
jgi:MATE family multidrug resistance protein